MSCTARLPVYDGRLEPAEGPVPCDEATAPIRDRLAACRQRLDARHPEALDLAAEVLGLLHRELRGDISALARELERTPRYLRGVLLGEHGLVLEDLVVVAALRPDVVRRALAVLLQPEDDGYVRRSIGQAAAALARAAGTLQADFAESVHDGRITLAELDGMLVAADALEAAVRAYRVTAINGRR